MGLLSRIINAAFALEKKDVEYGFYPWARSFKLAKDNSWNATAGWVYSKKRAEDFLYSDPIITTKGVFFFLDKNNFEWSSYQDLKDLNVGVTFSYFYGQKFSDAQKQGIFKTQMVNEDATNFKKILADRIDIFPSDLFAGYQLLADNFTAEEIQKFTYHPKSYNTSPLYLLFSKNHPDSLKLLKTFNSGLQKLKDSGELNRFSQEMKEQLYKAPELSTKDVKNQF